MKILKNGHQLYNYNKKMNYYLENKLLDENNRLFYHNN